jgi:DNA replication protein DnaC
MNWTCWRATGAGKATVPTLPIAAWRQPQIRFTTAAALANNLSRVTGSLPEGILACLSPLKLIAIDEVGYVPLAEIAAELLFQIIAVRAEKAQSSRPPTCLF